MHTNCVLIVKEVMAATLQKMLNVLDDNAENNYSEIDLKRKLIQATDSVRKKFNYIKTDMLRIKWHWKKYMSH